MNTLKLYFPLLVHFNEPGEPFNSLVELEEMNGAYYTETIKKAVEESLEAFDGKGLADDIHGPVGEKIISAQPSVEEVNGQLFGVINFQSESELTERDIALLQFWTYEEMTGEWSTEFENKAIAVEDGEVYVSFYNDIYDYTVETEEEFFGHDQGMEMI